MLVPPRMKRGIEHQFLVQREIGLNAFHDHFRQRDPHLGDGLLARVAQAMTLPISES